MARTETFRRLFDLRPIGDRLQPAVPIAEADDVARMVEYLLGDGGQNISRSVLTVDAGRTA